MVGEVAQQRRAVRRVHHLRMELHAVEASCVIGDDRERRAFGHRDGAEARRQRGDPIAVAHPHRLPAAFSPHAVEQRTVAGHLDDGAAELAGGAGLDPATQLFDHRLLPVADAENREARLQQRRVGARRMRLGDRRRPAGQDHRTRREPGMNAASTFVHGWISQYTPDSRTRRAISCVT